MQIQQQDTAVSMKIMEQVEVLTPTQDGRTMVLGRTGSGKSTLQDNLLLRYLALYPTARVLIIDSKPRFKAEYSTSGNTAERHYKKWSRGNFLQGSYRLENKGDIKPQLDTIWRMRGRVAIAQTRPGDLADLAWLEGVARVFYGSYSDKTPRLIMIDELADFFEVRRSGGIFHQAARSGRELGIGMLAGSQRPSYIPTVVMTESDRLYLFNLDYSEDMKKVHQMGVPKDVAAPSVDHSFFYWNKFTKFSGASGKYYILDLGDKKNGTHQKA